MKSDCLLIMKDFTDAHFLCTLTSVFPRPASARMHCVCVCKGHVIWPVVFGSGGFLSTFPEQQVSIYFTGLTKAFRACCVYVNEETKACHVCVLFFCLSVSSHSSVTFDIFVQTGDQS